MIYFFLSTHDIDLFGLTETLLDHDYPDTILSSNGVYNVFRKDRNRHGGGICLLVKKTANLLVELAVLPDEYSDMEILAVDIIDRRKRTSFRVILAYRPHSYDYTNNKAF